MSNMIPISYRPKEQEELDLIQKTANTFMEITEENKSFLQEIGNYILKNKAILPPSFAFLKDLKPEEVGLFMGEMHIDRLLEIEDERKREVDVFDKTSRNDGKDYLMECTKSFIATFQYHDPINIELLKTCNPYENKKIIGIIQYGFTIHHPKIRKIIPNKILVNLAKKIKIKFLSVDPNNRISTDTVIEKKTEDLIKILELYRIEISIFLHMNKQPNPNTKLFSSEFQLPPEDEIKNLFLEENYKSIQTIFEDIRNAQKNQKIDTTKFSHQYNTMIVDLIYDENDDKKIIDLVLKKQKFTAFQNLLSHYETAIASAQTQEQKLDAIFSFVSWCQNIHLFENGNGRMSINLVHYLLEKNKLPQCLLIEQDSFCLSYPVLKERFGVKEALQYVYYDSVKILEKFKEKIIEKPENNPLQKLKQESGYIKKTISNNLMF